MGLLTKEQILAVADIQHRDVPVPEWDGVVRIRSMTGADRDSHEQWMMAQPETDAGRRLDNFRAHMAALSIVGEDGELMFSDADVVALGKKSAAALGRVYDALVLLNAISSKDIDALVKN